MKGTGGCVAGGEERSRGDSGDRRGQGASLDGEAAGGETGPPTANGRREEAGRGHGGEELRCVQVLPGGTFHALCWSPKKCMPMKKAKILFGTRNSRKGYGSSSALPPLARHVR